MFISSTIKDLRDIRSDLKNFLINLDFEPIFSEKPSFEVSNDRNTYDNCLEAVENCDIHLLIIGSEYGSLYRGYKYSSEEKISITQAETRIAYENGLKVFTFVRNDSWNEWEFFKANEKNENLNFSSVKDKRIFSFIEEVNSRSKKNWIFRFETSTDLIEQLEDQPTFKKQVIELNNYPRIIGKESKSRSTKEILHEETEKRTLIGRNSNLPYLESISKGHAECLIYANTYNSYFNNSYYIEVPIGHHIELDVLKKIIEVYYHSFSEFEHHTSGFGINQETCSWFGFGPLNFLKTLEMQTERYKGLRERGEYIHHREAACFIDETHDSTFYIHMQPNRINFPEHNQEPTFDYVYLGLLFNEIPCCNAYKKFFDMLDFIPTTITEVNEPLTSFRRINFNIEKQNIIIEDPSKNGGGWVCGITSKAPRKLKTTDNYYENIIVHLNQYHEKDDICKYKLLSETVTTLPVPNFPAKIVNYKGKWE